HGLHPELPSFPTRRSSDLVKGRLHADHTIKGLARNGKSAGVAHHRSGPRRPELLPPGAELPLGDVQRDQGSRPADPGDDGILSTDRKSTRLNSSHLVISYA